MKYNQLSPLSLKALDAGKYGDGRGLYLIKRRVDSGKWIFRYSAPTKKRRDMGLGRWPDVTLGEARDLADEARALLRAGKDPIIERKRSTQSMRQTTVAEAIAGCFAAKQNDLKDGGTAGRWLSPLSVHVIPKIGELPIEQIDQHIIQSTLEPVWHSKPDAAEKALNRLSQSLRYAAALGLAVNLQAPGHARALLGKQQKRVHHIPSLPYKEVPAFYRWLADQSTTSALALRFLLLTVARTSEVRLAREIEVAGNVWTLSAERTKNGREHRVPLTDEALKVLDAAKEADASEYLFTSRTGRPLSDMAMSKFMREHGYAARPHGFRSSFRVWAEETTDADYAVKEACLGHVVDHGVVGAYQRSDRLEKRRKLLTDWAAYLVS